MKKAYVVSFVLCLFLAFALTNFVHVPKVYATTETFDTLIDGYVDEEYPTQTFLSETLMKIDPYSGERQRIIVSFDTYSSLPDNAIVSSSTLKFYCYQACEGRTYLVSRITAWGNTWNNPPTVTTTNQVTEASPFVSDWWNVDVTNMVQDAVNAQVNTMFRVMDNNEGTGLDCYFFTREAESPTLHPKLEVIYTVQTNYSRPVSTSVAVAALSSKALSKQLIESQFFTLTSALSKVFSRNVFESQLFRFTDSVSSRFQPFKILSVGVSIGQRQLQWLTSGAGGNTYPYQILQAMKLIGNVFRTTPHITYYLDTAVIFSAAASRVRTVIRDVLGELSVNAIISNVQYSFGKVLLDDIRGFLGLSSITYPYVAPTVAISGGSPGVVTPAEEAAAAQAIAAAAVYGMSTEVLQRVSIGIAAAMALIFIWGVTGETKKNGKKKKRSWNI